MASATKKQEVSEEPRQLTVPEALAAYVKANKEFIEFRWLTFSVPMRAKASAILQAGDELLKAMDMAEQQKSEEGR